MTIDSIGSHPLGMDDESMRLEESATPGTKVVQSSVEAGYIDKHPTAIGKDPRADLPEPIPTPAEAGADRLGESKFQGMMVRDNLQLSSRAIIDDGSLPGGLQFSSKAIIDDDNSPGGLQFSSKAIIDDGNSPVWAEKFAAGLPAQGETGVKLDVKGFEVQDKLSFPKTAANEKGVIQDNLSFPKLTASFFDQEHAGNEPIEEASRQGNYKEIPVSENLILAGQPNIWGERLAGDSESGAEPEIQDKLNFPKLSAQAGGAEAAIQDDLSFPKMVASQSSQKLEDI